MTFSQRIATNVLYQFACQVLLLSLSFAVAPYIVHHLGVESYGILLLVGLTTNYFGVAELGVGQASIKFMADSFARRDWDEFRRVFWTSISTYLCLGAITALALVAVTPWLVHLLRVPPASRVLTQQALYISAVGLFISMMSSIVSAVPRALERFDIFSFVGVTVGVCQVVLNLLLLHFGYSLLALISAGTAIQLAVLVVYACIAKKLVPFIGRPQWNSGSFRKLLRFGSLAVISQLVGPILTNAEKFILGSLSTVSAVTFYSVSYNLSSAITAVPCGIAGVLFPTFSRLTAEQDLRRSTDLLVRSTKYLFAGVLPLAIVLALFSREFLGAWMGHDFATHSAPVLCILVFAAVINAVAIPSFQALQAMGRPDLPAKCHLFELCLHIPICYFLISRYGILGGGIAWTGRILIDTVLQTRICSRLVGLTYHTFLYRTLFRTALTAVCLSPALFLTTLWLQDLNRFMTLLTVAGVAFLYLAAIFYVSLDGAEKRHLRSLVDGLMKRQSVLPLSRCST
jgi:O-antigen/teichoic acid export membrane protein